MQKKTALKKSPSTLPHSHKTPSLMVIVTTVLMDLVGFGIIIPLVGLYGKDLGASAFQLGILGASYSLMQFFFNPIWGGLSDKVGRKPIILMSLAGSCLSYLGFALATQVHSYWLLLLTRTFQGTFAANLATAQAYIADITSPKDRAKGMGLFGASFGVGFILGPALGGIAAKHWGLASPGYVASVICGLNFLMAMVRLPESLALEIRKKNKKSSSPRGYDPLNTRRLKRALAHPYLGLLLLMTFLQIFAFSNMEQTFSLLFQRKFGFPTEDAGENTGLVLAWVGIIGVLVQGGLIRKLAPKFGERRLLMVGLFLFSAAIFLIPFGPSFRSYYWIMLPLAFGRSLIDPSMSSLISKSADATDQGGTLGLSQGLASLARAVGPFCGLVAFEYLYYLPYLVAGLVVFFVFLLSIYLWRKTQGMALDASS